MISNRITTSMPENVEYICKIMFDVLKIPVYFMDNVGSVFFSYSYNNLKNPLASENKDLFLKLFNNMDSIDYPIVKSTSYLENYLAVNLNLENFFIGRFIIGPSAYFHIGASSIDNLISEHEIPIGLRKNLIDYFETIPIIDFSRLISTGLLLYHSIYGKMLDSAEVIEKNSSLDRFTEKINNNLERIVSQNLQSTLFHHSTKVEKKIFNCVREGNIELLMEELQNPPDGEYGILSKDNPLRNQKNMTICFVTLATRAAIEGGLNSELAYTLSDLYIQTLEEITDIKDLFALNNKILSDFTARVREAKKREYSRPVIACQDYIFKHLYDNISVSEVSHALRLSTSYLSQLFKKEVGMPLSEFIHHQKIEEAKRLLASPDYSILDIGTLLSFHDQSHFTKLFKKITGTTPRKYREKNAI